jgi:hypothetical protein
MEHTGVTPPGAVVAPDLAEVVDVAGPYLSMYLVTESGIDNAAHRSEQHWKSVRAELVAADVPETVLAAVEPVVPEAHLRGECLGVVANGDGVLLVEHGPVPPPLDRWAWAPLPRLLPVLGWRQAFPTHLVVVADRTGADIFVSTRDAAIHEEVTGGGYPLSKNNPGGWSQPRYQRRAENTWEHNADEVVADVVALADRFQPRLVVVAGDVRALELIRKALPRHLAESLEEVGGSRAEDGSDVELWEGVRGRLAGAAAADTVHLLGKLREELGQGDRAVDGPEATLAALARAQVEVLLAHDDPGDERTAWFGPEPTQVGASADDVRALGVEDPTEARLVDVAVRAALGTGAGIRVVPAADEPTGGVGAILRWSDGS